MTLRHLFAIVFSLVIGQAHAAGSGGGGGFGSLPSPTTAKPKTPEEISAGHYAAGLKHKERAWKQEAKAAEATDEKRRERALARAEREYKKAIDRQGKAIQAMSSNYQAANELGYALRKTGDFKTALEAYDLALTIKPDYFEAVEYRGQAYLALGRFDEAKKAYMLLFNNDPELANQLINAMSRWADDNAAAPLTQEAAAFREWVAERRALAQLTQAYRPAGSEAW